MKTRLQSISLLCDNKQQVGTNGYPYLRVGGIAGCTIKDLNMQMLLYPLEEDLNLPSSTIKLCNSNYVNQEVFGEETIDFPISKVFIYNESQIVGILLIQ